ncbi:hypothetical protein [Pseudalkalibacillus sp. NRS-1564]|uniref:hypothetical protein n=1 Tax=Pseudalkalibacillus sp. NRS-1564 TaxID=3233900 RepID=UPI003D2C8925
MKSKLLKSVLFLSMFMLIASSFSFGSNFASAAENDKKSSFKEEINEINVEVPYKKSEVKIEKSKNDQSESMEVIDIKTNKVLRTYTVEDVDAPIALASNKNAALANTTFKDVSETRDDNGLETTLRARLEIYSSGSFAQIQDIVSYNWFTSSGNHTLESESADGLSTSGSFPTNEVEILGDATIQAAISQSASAGFEAAGFSISAGTGSTYYARKDISIGFRYSIY